MEKILAPFTDAQVDNLNLFQKFPFVHPFTCDNDNCRENLVAIKEGLLCPRCGYKQDWAWGYMADKIVSPLPNYNVNLVIDITSKNNELPDVSLSGTLLAIDEPANCPCANCGATEGVSWSPSNTNYSWDGKGQDPNAPVALCPDCRLKHDEYWTEQWKEINENCI
jgi:hypothetical protein